MPLQIHCPSCQRSLRVPSQQAGQTVRCPNCGRKLTAPPKPSVPVAKDVPDETGQPVMATLVEPAPSATPPSAPPPLRAKPPGHPSEERPPMAAESSPPPPAPPPLRPDAALAAEPLLGGPPPAVAPPPIPPSPGTTPTLLPVPAPDPLPGVEHSWIRRWPVYQLGMWIIAAAVVGAIPVLLDVVTHVRHDESTSISRWALALLLASGLQAAYAGYLLQLPDWCTAWVISIVMLVCATGYAALLGALTLANQQSQLVQFLELGDLLPGGQAMIWCLVMLGIYSLLAYLSGRISFRWRRMYWRSADG